MPHPLHTGPPTHIYTVPLLTPIPTAGNEKYKHLITGGMAAAIARTATAPLERVKILRQCGTNKYANLPLRQVFSSIYRNEGFTGYFKGNAVNIVRLVPFSGIELFTFEVLKGHFFVPGEKRNKMKLLGLGVLSGVSASTFTYPLDVLRT
jgi:solute carrier family 25 protein 16